MRKWIYSCNRKRHQRVINKAIRDMNKNIENDNLWKGRFYCRQIYSPYWEVYSDKSGGIMHVHVEFCDKKTQKRWIQLFSTNDMISYRFWMAMNDFIVKHIKVWEEVPPPNLNSAPDWIEKTVDMKWEIWGEEI